MEKCKRCYGTGEMDTECCNGAGGCSCKGQTVYLPCTYCDGTGYVEDNEEAQKIGAVKYKQMYGGFCFLGSGPKDCFLDWPRGYCV